MGKAAIAGRSGGGHIRTVTKESKKARVWLPRERFKTAMGEGGPIPSVRTVS
jgi:L,D-peptidoglycan transpeptidase YkuD (ErfK/YbiS/YcfS/YnhG family)